MEDNLREAFGIPREYRNRPSGISDFNYDIKIKYDVTKVPKLFQWLLGGGAFIAVWAAIILEYIVLDLNDSTKDVVLFFPVFVAVAFAFYSIAVIGYRVATFNDCLAAAEELQLEIEDSRKDLKSKGFKFD